MLIDRLVRLLLPRQGHFFDLLEGLADHIEISAKVFAELATAVSHSQIESIAARLKPIETEADGMCHRLYEELDRTFVTPIDREDLAALAKALDDVVDGMEHTAAFGALFQFEELTEPMKQLVRITQEAAVELSKATRLLRKFGDPELIRQPTIAVHTLENEADAIYRRAIAELFADSVAPGELVRRKDMLFSLETGVDQCEDAMDVIRSVAVKNG